MIHKLKALGLALAAVFAFSAMAASSASAVDVFTGPAASFPVTAIGTDNKFEITGPGTFVACQTAHFTGTGINGNSQLTVTPHYTGTTPPSPTHSGHCRAPGGSANVNMNGCDYTLTGNTTGSDGGTDATVWVVCTPSTNEITITTALGCTLDIPGQTPTSGGVTYTNEAGKVKVKATATGITYTATGFACALGGIPSEGNNADYTGNVVASSTMGNISWSQG